MNTNALSEEAWRHYQLKYHIDRANAVKFGLRNADGTGVIVGVTGLGSAQGYMMLDGEPIPMPGRLYYRGIDIRQIIDAHVEEGSLGFGEVAYLLLMGELPAKHQLEYFQQTLAEVQPPPREFLDLLAMVKTPNLMNKLSTAFTLLYSYDDDPDDPSFENLMRQSMEMTAWTPYIVGYCYCKQNGLAFRPPKPEYSLAENLLYMLRPDGEFQDGEARLLDIMLIIDAEHGGGTPSTFANRLLSSTGTDTYSALSADISTLKSVRDGGVEINAHCMYDNILKHVPNMKDEAALADYLRRVREGQANDGSGIIYGIGHSLYTQSDPRTILLKQVARQVAEEKGYLKDLENLEVIERVALRVLAENTPDPPVRCASADMYLWLMYRMLDIPQELYVPIATCAHVPAWCAHRIEEVVNGKVMLRPAYRCIAPRVDYVPMDKRG